MKQLYCLLAALLLGCVTSKNLARLDTGMTKEQVIAQLGKPHSVKKKGDTEYLIYYLEREVIGGDQEYFVLLLNGRVEAFGERGDFDTALLPVERLEIRHR